MLQRYEIVTTYQKFILNKPVKIMYTDASVIPNAVSSKVLSR